MALLAQPNIDPGVDLADVLVATPYAPERGLGGVAASIALAGTNSLHVIGNELAWYHNGTNGASYTSLGTPTLVDGQFTVAVRFWIAGANQTTVFNSRNNDTTTGALQIRISTAGALEILSRGVASQITVAGAIRPGRWCTVVVRRGRPADGSGGTADHKVWIDGALAGRSSGSGTGNHGEFAVAGGAIASTGGQTNTHWVSFAAVIPSPTADHVCAALSADPWVLVRPANDDAFVVDAGGSPVEIEATTGAAVAASLLAGVASPITVAAALGAVHADGRPAVVASAITLAASAGAAAASGLTAQVASSITITAAAGAAAAQGQPASVAAGAAVNAATGQAQAAGAAAGIASAVSIAAGVGAASAAGQSASVATGAVISAAVGQAQAVGLDAGISSPIAVAAGAGAAVAAGMSAAVSAGNTVAASLGVAAASGLAVVVSSPQTVAAGTADGDAAGLAASIGSGATIPAGLGAAAALGLTATVTAATHIVAGAGTAYAAGLVATLGGVRPAIDVPHTRQIGPRNIVAAQARIGSRRTRFGPARIGPRKIIGP